MNFYGYADNNPVENIDPSGWNVVYTDYNFTVGALFGGTFGIVSGSDGSLYIYSGPGVTTPTLSATDATYSFGSPSNGFSTQVQGAGGLPYAGASIAASVDQNGNASMESGGGVGASTGGFSFPGVGVYVTRTLQISGPSDGNTITVPSTSEPLPNVPNPDDPIPDCPDDQDDPFPTDPDIPDPSGPENITSDDPNNIIGPAGFGPENFVSGAAPLSYTIDFENAATATAPAQVVTITQQLDPNLNWNTFRLTGFGFDNLTYTLSGTQAFYSAQLDLSATKGYYVDVSAGVNITTGLVTWTFTTIDPATGQTSTLNPLTGFLPPNDANNDGQAYVSYTIEQKVGLPSGSVVTAGATVVFDGQGPVNTPMVSDTIDDVAPTSDVQALPAETNDPTFQVSWSGQDDPNGSGIADYTIYVSTDGGTAVPWLTDTALTNALFTGVAGNTYAFSSTATDNAGNTEAEHATADTAIQVMCFAGGTRIRTTRGEIAVEDLDHGDEVVAHSGALEPIQWMGHRHVDCRRHPRPQKVWPVRVRAGAFDDHLPCSDLWLSPDHAVFADDVLIPVKHLINGTSIAQVPVDEVTYYHIELRRHEVVFAEGMPAESYLDTGDRSNFANSDGEIRLFPDFSTRSPDAAMLWEAYGYAPLIVTGPQLEAVRVRLSQRAAMSATRPAVDSDNQQQAA